MLTNKTTRDALPELLVTEGKDAGRRKDKEVVLSRTLPAHIDRISIVRSGGAGLVVNDEYPP
jgi:hypothetical protein